jgi:spore coat polysaccharide biosynthesis protein SpsF
MAVLQPAILPRSAVSTYKEGTLKVLTLLQARLGSSRFPGKILKPLGAGTVLSEMLARVQAAKLAGQIVVATTTDAQDEPIVAHCRSLGVEVFRGHPLDLLDRHYQAQQSYRSDITVKIPTDCPLIDPAVIDQVIGVFLENPGRWDYVSNLHPPTYPDGNDVEVMAAGALARAWKEAHGNAEREHTTPYLWDNPEKFGIHNVVWETGLDYSQSHRWVLDYPEDYEFIQALHERLSGPQPLFGVRDILACLDENPQLRSLNARWLGDSWYLRQGDELKTLNKP